MPPANACFFGGQICGEVLGVSACDVHMFRVVLYRLVDGRYFAMGTSSLDECCRFRFRDLRPGEYLVALLCAWQPALIDSQCVTLNHRCMERMDICLRNRAC